MNLFNLFEFEITAKNERRDGEKSLWKFDLKMREEFFYRFCRYFCAYTNNTICDTVVGNKST